MAVMAIHPGEHLAEELKALEMSAAELARKIAVPTNRVTQILNGTRSVTGDTALRLGHFFGTSPRFWLNLQTLYDVRIAERQYVPTVASSAAVIRSASPATTTTGRVLALGSPSSLHVISRLRELKSVELAANQYGCLKSMYVKNIFWATAVCSVNHSTMFEYSSAFVGCPAARRLQNV